MSTFGSSVINKSGKKLAPKAPLGRRRAGPASESTQASTRASEERHPPLQAFQSTTAKPRTTDSSLHDQRSGDGEHAILDQASSLQPIPENNEEAVPSLSDSTQKQTTLQAQQSYAVTEKLNTLSSELREADVQQSGHGTLRNVLADESERTSTSQNTSIPLQTGNDISAGSSPLREERTIRTPHQDVTPQPNHPTARHGAQHITPPTSQPSRVPDESFTEHANKRRKVGEHRREPSQTELGPRPSVQPAVEESSNNAQESNVAGTAGSKPRKPRAKTQKKMRPSENSQAEKSDRSATRKSREPTGTRRGRKRQKTPENAETMEIAPSIVKMADLCRDNRLGKKSKREAELQNMDWTAVIKRQKERQAQRDAGEIPPKETVDDMLERAGREQELQSRGLAAPQMRLINGQIVLDDQSLQIDRHAHAARDQEEREEVEENELTRRITAGSWMKREKTEPWTEDYTDLFYQGLRMFGTDFMMISKMFPNRSRRQIKLKFCKEERLDPLRIHEALTGPREPVDLAHYSEMTNEEYSDPALLEQELAAEAERFEAEHLAQKSTSDVDPAKGQVNSIADAGNADSSAKENESQETLGAGAVGKRAKKPGGRTKKSIHSRHGVSDEVEVLGTVDELMQR